MNTKFLSFFLLLSITALTVAEYNNQIVCIIIHGTWASTTAWYRPQGDFFQTLEKSDNNKSIKFVSFTWSGANNNSARQEAGLQLAYLIDSYDPATPIFIISHSHGGNVACIASQRLQPSEHGFRIKRLYTLGTPVSVDTYPPNMNVIGQMYHLFSFNDLVQPVLGLFERTFENIERCANIRLMVNGSEPRHTELHSPIIAQWILHIASIEPVNSIENFEQFSFEKPSIIHLQDNASPRYEIDKDRKILVQKDTVRMRNLKRRIYEHVIEQTA